jgi:hypothetical protein
VLVAIQTYLSLSALLYVRTNARLPNEIPPGLYVSTDLRMAVDVYIPKPRRSRSAYAVHAPTFLLHQSSEQGSRNCLVTYSDPQ